MNLKRNVTTMEVTCVRLPGVLRAELLLVLMLSVINCSDARTAVSSQDFRTTKQRGFAVEIP